MLFLYILAHIYLGKFHILYYVESREAVFKQYSAPAQRVHKTVKLFVARCQTSSQHPTC